MKQKRVFKSLLLLLTIFFIMLPVLVTFDEALTRIVENFVLYKSLQEVLVPLEIRMVKILTYPLGVNFTAYTNGMYIHGTFLNMTWNCIGWQSLLLLGVTLLVGLGGTRYTFGSKLEVLLIGIFGTFLVNLFRLSMIVLIFNYARPIFAYVYHNYLAVIVTVIWLFVFWWFSYKFVLEEKGIRSLTNDQSSGRR